MNEQKFREKVTLLSDPYFDREFFTNLIYCVDRKKSARQIFEAVMAEVSGGKHFTQEVDRAILHMFYAYQCSSSLKESYQWLPLSQGIYSAALFRGDGQKVVGPSEWPKAQPQAFTLKELEEILRPEVRGVSNKETAWNGLLFLLDNRSSRSEAAALLIRQAILGSDAMTFELIVKALDIALSSGWKANAAILKRPFDRFWSESKSSEFLDRARRLVATAEIRGSDQMQIVWSEEWSEDLWKKLALQSPEAAWDYVSHLLGQGAQLEQLFSYLTLLRGRCYFGMKTEQWSQVASSLVYADALHSASRWSPKDKYLLLALGMLDIAKTLRLVGPTLPARPTGASVLDGVSKNISKDRLVLRLDDALEKGARRDALELMAVILKDQGLSHSVSDRLQLVASKQDGWTYDFRTIPSAVILCRAFDACNRLKVKGEAVLDGLYGLLRFLSDQREVSLGVVPKTGTYGDGLSPSQFDVSGGARIVDRFVFNQMRNGQRIKIWPSNN